MKRQLALASLILLAGCVSAPAPLQVPFTPITPADAVKRGTAGDPVRWGGTIARVEPHAERTCFEIVGRALDDRARPYLGHDHSTGRFLACRAGFYDPEVFARHRAVTVAGRIDSFESRRIGDYDYRYPRVAAEVIYLWPERREVDVIYTSPYPWWGW